MGRDLTGMEGLSITIMGQRRGRRTTVEAAVDVSLTLGPGRVHALVGESGSGKSVLAATLSGLVPAGSSVQGRVLVEGQDVTTWLGHPRDRRWQPLRGRVVGAVSQSAATSFTPTRSIGNQLDEVVAALDGSLSAPELCDRVGLPPDVLDRHPHELSGGMAQRAALAAALAGQPRILVADEPTSALDRGLAREVLQLLRGEADAGVAVLLVTHDLQALLDEPVADELSVMHRGRIREQGSAHQVLTHPTDPYARALVEALPRRGLVAPTRQDWW